MDTHAVLKELDELLGLIDEYNQRIVSDAIGRAYTSDDMEEIEREIIGRLAGIERIARSIQPGLASHALSRQKKSNGVMLWEPLKATVLEVRGDLARRDHIDEMLGPSGPRLNASELHPWVWKAAVGLWDNGHQREAVQAAATSIEIELRGKLGVLDGDGYQLVQAFRVDAKSSKMARLRRPGYEPDTKDFVSAHDGAASYAAGCFQAIRNISTHRLEIEDALEMLAALSLLARWIDRSEVGQPEVR